MVHTCMNVEESGCLFCLYEDDEQKLAKLRKIQSFIHGWLRRRKWKQVVEQYIKSPFSEGLRKRYTCVLEFLEGEKQYVQQIAVLITCFSRPLKMAASSKKPSCTLDDVNSICLNSEALLLLHQIFLEGLTARLESSPPLVLGDLLLTMLLPKLNIYQEYVRNHHYSLQVLTECCDILLDVEQTFVRKGDLIQILIEKPKERVTFKKFESFRRSDKDVARECFLFSYHLIVTTRGSDGKLHLEPNVGKIPMSEASLIEEPNEESTLERPCESASSVTTEQDTSYQGRDFKVVLSSKNLVTPVVIHFVAPTLSDKAAWISDLANCMNNAQFREIFKPLMANTSSINLP
ncbi:unnamed protein product [Ceutorhynchus assimilis]|uniref:DH domain-containing protein n=1 Tax=Ceutorhynchus assimilis TaxID=467358 RepID=A0A9N9MK58_9CUCU|nr:unnamed protein product [Ceutorhynchus assimilis]